MKIIGITGTTGAGKTTALNALKSLDGWVMDCDEVYHQLLIHCEPMRQELREQFGAKIFQRNGELDRKALGAVVFSDPEALNTLNRITHKYVCDAVDEFIAKAEQVGVPAVAIDAVALIESGIAGRCHCTVAITAPEECRVERIMMREGITQEYAWMRVNSQKKEEWFRANCTYVLNNDCADAKQFCSKARELFEKILNQ